MVFFARIRDMFHVRRSGVIVSMNHPCPLPQQVSYSFSDLIRQERRNGIADLPELVSLTPLKEKIVRECLQSRCLPDGKASALRRVIMDVVVSVFPDVAYHRSGRAHYPLYAEPVTESVVRQRCLHIPVVWSQSGRKVPQAEWMVSCLLGASRERVPPKVVLPMAGPGPGGSESP